MKKYILYFYSHIEWVKNSYNVAFDSDGKS